MLTRILLTLIILGSAAQVYAEASLFLYPKIEKKAKITVGDIAKIDASPSVALQLAALEIDEKLYADGMVDRRELFTLLRKNSGDNFIIYGHATRILTGRNADLAPIREEITKGQSIKVIITYRGITIETNGMALEDGSTGDTIAVKLHKKKIIKCKIVNNGIVAKSS